MYKDTTSELLGSTQRSPSCFYTVSTMKDMLLEDGHTELWEYKTWTLEKDGKYFITRNDSNLIALHAGSSLGDHHFQVILSHLDSPTFRIKGEVMLRERGGYLQLSMESYGGMPCATWVDRPLSLVRRILVKEGNTFTNRLVSFDRDLLLIPNIAIYMNHDVNSSMKYNNQMDMLPLLSAGECNEGDYAQLLADELGYAKEGILRTDLYLVSHTAPSIWGVKEESISSPKLDDLQCVLTPLGTLLRGTSERAVDMFACFDNEEVDSGTKQGTCSAFLYDILQRIDDNLGYTRKGYYCAVARSFMVSYDNAHAVHPNHPEKANDINCIYMNRGVAVKFSVDQKYTTDVVDSAVFARIRKKVGVPIQHSTNRSDTAGGNTLGDLSSRKVSMHIVDVGLTWLAIHSFCETAGVKDDGHIIHTSIAFYNTNLCITGSETTEIIQVSIENQSSRKEVHIDSLYLIEKLDEDYHKGFMRFYDYILHDNTSDTDINVVVSTTLEQCLEGMKSRKKATLVVPRDLKECTTKLFRGNVHKDMRRRVHNQGYERMQVSSIWYVSSLCIALFLLRNLMDQKFIVNYLAGIIIVCVIGEATMKNFLVRKRIIKRYRFDSFYMRMDVTAVVACVFIRTTAPATYANSDTTYLLLVTSFFIVRREIKPQFETVI